jgi:acetyltransferase-like isoleucine patch superfamily enzyme
MNFLKKIIVDNHPYIFLKKIGLAIQKNYFALSFGQIGENVKIYGLIHVVNPKNIFIENNSSLNKGCLLNAKEKIKIGNFCHISPY